VASTRPTAANSRHVEGQGGLAHRRPPGDDDQVGALESGGEAIEGGETAGQAGHLALVTAGRVELVEGLLHDRRHVGVSGSDPLLGRLEDRGLGAIQEILGVAEVAEAVRHHLLSGVDHPAHRGLLPHQPRVVLDVGHGGDAVGQPVESRGAADFFQIAAQGELVAQGHVVHGQRPLGQILDRRVDPAVGLDVEVLGPEHLLHDEQRVVVQQDAPEHGGLGLLAVWGYALGRTVLPVRRFPAGPIHGSRPPLAAPAGERGNNHCLTTQTFRSADSPP